MITGNITGIKKTTLSTLELLFEVYVDRQVLVNDEILDVICRVTGEINREISIAINRTGKVIEISVGDSNTVSLPKIDVTGNKLSGIRIIHTHPNGSSILSTADTSALMLLKLDAMVAVGVIQGKPHNLSLAMCQMTDKGLNFIASEILSIEEGVQFPYIQYVLDFEKGQKKGTSNVEELEKALLIGVDSKQSLDELSELAFACDIEVCGIFLQNIKKIDSKYYIGSGKVSDVAMERQVKGASLVIFDEELSGMQLKKLEERIGCRVIDRTMLILEIFSRRAQTREAKLQVSLAKLKYESARLIGLGSEMSRIGGGVGSKGSGEQKLELDKRNIRDTIHRYKQELKIIQKTKEIQRHKRNKTGMINVALVGYTNVGKSTLRNLLSRIYQSDLTHSKSDVFAKNMLFATLSTTTRTITLPDLRKAALTDTVGFIRKLPHDLVESFKTTLDEVLVADLLLHVIDAQSEDSIEQIIAVEKVLEEIQGNEIPVIYTLNKCDQATKENKEKLHEYLSGKTVVEISARDECNIDNLMTLVMGEVPSLEIHLSLLIPHFEQKLIALLNEEAVIITREYENEFVKLEIKIQQSKVEKLNLMKYKS